MKWEGREGRRKTSLTRRCLVGLKTSENTSSNHRWCRLPPFEGRGPGQRCGDAWVTGGKRRPTWKSSSFMAEGDALWALNQAGEGRQGKYEEQDLDLKVQGLAQTLTSDLDHQKPCRFTLLLFQHLERKKQVISQPRNKEPTNDTNIYRVPTRRHLIL